MNVTFSTRLYPLVIETTVDESGSVGSYYAKGHAHTSWDFIDAVQAKGDGHLRADEIEYHWYRKRPLLPAEREEFCFGHWIDSAKPGTPGAFPVMVIYVG